MTIPTTPQERVTDLTPTICARTGLWTWPEIVQYRITEGPQKGTVLNNPPRRKIYPAPIEKDPATGRTGRRVGSAAFLTIRHDEAACKMLERSGALYHPMHTGAEGVIDDNQRTG